MSALRRLKAAGWALTLSICSGCALARGPIRVSAEAGEARGAGAVGQLVLDQRSIQRWGAERAIRELIAESVSPAVARRRINDALRSAPWLSPEPGEPIEREQ